jgi:hypothetical protein
MAIDDAGTAPGDAVEGGPAPDAESGDSVRVGEYS